MNNRTQQRFDRSIAEAVAVTKAAVKPARAPRAPKRIPKIAKVDHRGWKLRIDPQTGGTIWGPA